MLEDLPEHAIFIRCVCGEVDWDKATIVDRVVTSCDKCDPESEHLGEKIDT